MNCYILGSVTGGTENSEALFNTYKKVLKEKYNIIGTPLETAAFKGTLEERFERAKNAIQVSDTVFADLSSASTGAGIEIGMAYMQNKKIVVLAKTGSKVSGLVLGLVGENNVFYYDDYNHLETILKKFI